MQYTAEVLDHATGDLKEVSLGDWITVTELGEQYGVGSNLSRPEGSGRSKNGVRCCAHVDFGA
jgi:hypothetical protein